MKKYVAANWPSLLVISIGLLFGLFLYPDLPAQIPVHFNSEGIADRFGDKWNAIVSLPLISLMVLVLVRVQLKIAPSGYSAEQSEKSIALVNLALTLFLIAIHVCILLEAKGHSGLIRPFLPLGLSFLSIFMGNYFGKLEKNFVVGYRLPWTIVSEDNWKRTHRFAGKLHVSAGILGVLVSLVWPNIWFVLGGAIAVAIVVTFYSYNLSQKKERSV